MYINGLKYACSSCIKGHRSSQCNHADRPLIEIRKKGRPITQCSFCRDLRKKHQVHIKCICNNNGSNCHDKKEQQQQMTAPLSLVQTEHANDCITAATTSSENAATVHQQCACLSKLLGTTTKHIIPFISAASFTKEDDRASSPPDHNHSQKSTATQDGSLLPISSPLCVTTTNTTSVSSNGHCVPDGDFSEMLPSSSSSVTSDYTRVLDSLPSAVKEIKIVSSCSNKDAVDSSKKHYHYHHKPISSNTTTQRFLDGQPRIRTTGASITGNGIHRKKSATKRGNSSSSFMMTSPQQQQQLTTTSGLFIDTLTTATKVKAATDESLSTPPPSIASPHPSESLTSSNRVFCDSLTSSNNILDMQFDYLTEQLEIISNSNSNNDHYADLFNTTTISQQQDEDAFLSSMLSSSSAPIKIDEDTAMVDLDMSNTDILGAITTTTTTTATAASTNTTPTNNNSTTTSIIQPSQCGSFIPHSNCTQQATCAAGDSGESVVITITPLSDHPNSQSNITTRIVTCYCGQQCMCPGCLVHPHQQFIYNNNCSSTTTTTNSSCCSEEQG